MNKLKCFFLTAIKGILLGFAMVIPGLSGGTIAFVLGIYEKLIKEIACFQFSNIKSVIMLFSFNKAKIKKHLLVLKTMWDWSFLLPLSAGGFFAIVFFVVFASGWIQESSLIFYSFVFGLICASLIPPAQQIKKSFQTFFLFLISFLVNFCLFYCAKDVFLISKDPHVIVFAPVGFLISIALIIPGVSGSYILLLLGLYERTLTALKQLDVLPVLLFVIGLILGFFFTARGIQKMLKNYKDQSLAVILGLILGSLPSIYPLSLSPFVWSTDHATFFIFMSLGFFLFLIISFIPRFQK